jgi:hypothetical protein
MTSNELLLGIVIYDFNGRQEYYTIVNVVSFVHDIASSVG